MRETAIRSVVIAGGGIVGWSAAAALKRRLPALAVTVVPVPPPANALADRIGSTLPSITEFHADIGLGEEDAVARAGSAFRLGTRFEGWTDELPAYLHVYGECGRPFGASSFHQHWLRALQAGSAAPFTDHSPAAAMASAGRFIHPRAEADTPLATFGYGLQIDVPRYREMMRAYALHLGVAERPGTMAGLRLRSADGFVEALQLEGGSGLAADLFVDATGPQARLRRELDDAWEDWSHWLPCDRLFFAEKAAPAELAPIDRVSAIAGGWRWEAASRARSSHGLVYCSGFLSDAKAERLLRNASTATLDQPPVSLQQGRRPEPWLRNCVAIGDAAVAVEPLEWTNLHLAHNAIDRLVAMMPDRDCSPVELWDFNRQTAAETDRVRDFLVLHYVTARRPREDFWRDVSGRTPPPSLAHTLTQFRERGRLPFYEDETFSRDSWLTVLFGQGIMPRRIDPLIETTPLSDTEWAMAQMRQNIQALVQRLPTHSEYLRNFSEQVVR